MSGVRWRGTTALGVLAVLLALGTQTPPAAAGTSRARTAFSKHSHPHPGRGRFERNRARYQKKVNLLRTKGPRHVEVLDRATLKARFPGAGEAELKRKLSQGRWKPPVGWLETEGKRYGRLLIVSDLHPSTGRNAVTYEINPREDFLPSKEARFVSMVESQWAEVAAEGIALTLVLNGDVLEFLQTDRPATGMTFTGPEDRFGPLNTPKNTSDKLDAIRKGHPGLFGAYAEHLVLGHPLVLVPGNHDRQLVHPTVLAKFKQILIADVAAKLEAGPAFAATSPGRRRKLARLRAKQIVATQFEFHPWFFMHGDVVVRHGNETDRHNNFSTPFGEFYHPGGKAQPIESALGDYIVKAIVNKAERRETWIDNTADGWRVAKAVFRTFGFKRLVGIFGYLLTREGADLSPDAVSRSRDRLGRDVARYVREYDLLRKFNLLRPADQQLDETALNQLLLGYESQSAQSTLTRFDRRWGGLARLGRLLWGLGQIAFGDRSREVEQAMTDTLFSHYVSTVAVGHDHKQRLEPRLMIDGQGNVARGEVIDSESWTGGQSSAVIIDTDVRGSHPKLMQYTDRGFELAELFEDPTESGIR